MKLKPEYASQGYQLIPAMPGVLARVMNNHLVLKSEDSEVRYEFSLMSSEKVLEDTNGASQSVWVMKRYPR